MPTLTIYTGAETITLQVEPGANLRQTLLDNGLTPYVTLTRRANCGGRGICATCGVWIDAPPKPTHWHDKAAHTFGYPRLSCQIVVEQDMTVRLIPEKWIWGGRKK